MSPPNFDRLARLYRWMEWLSFGPWLARCRRAFLHRATDRCCALILGDGDGRFTASLLRLNSHIEVDAVDASPAMLRELLRRAGHHRPRVRTHHADARQWAPHGDRRYDLVATHFFLDCLTTGEIRRLATTVKPALDPKANWLISEFAVPEGRFGALFARPLVAGLYRAFALLTGLRVRRLPDHHAAMRDAGFIPAGQRTFLHGLLVAEIWTPADSPSGPSGDTAAAGFAQNQPTPIDFLGMAVGFRAGLLNRNRFRSGKAKVRQGCE